MQQSLWEEGLQVTSHVCPICGTAFTPSRSDRKCCSKKCCRKARYEKNKEKLKEWYRKHKKKLKARVCPVCGKEFFPFRSNHKYCSRKCYLKAYSEKNKEKRKAYYEKNKEKFKAYREKNKERIKARAKAYREKNKDKIKAKEKAYREKNKGKIKTQREKNKEKKCRNPKQIYQPLLKRKNHIPIKMTQEEFVDWYNSKPKICCYCGIPENSLKVIDYIPEHRRSRLQIERIDNDKGYELDNIDLACYACNMIHQKPLSFEEIREIAEHYITPKWKSILCVRSEE